MRKKLSFIFALLFIISGLSAVGIPDITFTNNVSDENTSVFDDVSLYQYEYECEGDFLSRDWSIVATYPIPEGASGLAYDGTNLYCGIYGANGDEVYQIDPSTGDFSLLFTGPQDDAFGLSFDGTYIWTTDHPGGGSTPAIAMQLDMSGNLISQFNLPAHYMSGIAYDSGDFWVAAYYDPDGQIYKVDITGGIITQFPAPDNQPWDLCVENGNLWMVDYWGDALYKIDPTTGDLLETHDSEGVDPSGVVWDGSYLWYCDNGQGIGQDYLYKIDLQGGGTPGINVPVTTHDYGEVAVGESDIWDVTIQSVGTDDLELLGISFTGSDDLSCPDVFPITIPQAGQDQISIIYEPSDIGPLDAIATITSNDPVHSEVDITLTGNGVTSGPDIYLPEDNFNYYSVRINATTRRIMEIQNVGDDMLSIQSISSDDDHFYIDDQVSYPIDLGVLSSVDIGLWFSPESAESYSGTITITSNDPDENPYYVTVEGVGVDQNYPIGDQLWSYLIDDDPYDNSPKAIAPIEDVSGDGVGDVIICSEDDYIRCFNGNAHAIGDVLWEHEIYSGSVYQKSGLAVTDDVDYDGYDDVVVASAWGGRLIRTISGKTGEEIWTHDTHEYGDGGWVYSVDCSYDYNNDGIIDVLASTGDDSSDQGPKRIYCLNGETGVSIWERPLGGPGFSAIGVEDFTGDDKADVVAGASNEGETIGYVYGINGQTGVISWTFTVSGTSVWALEQIDDINSDGIKDVIAGDFSGHIYLLDAASGTQEHVTSLGGVIVLSFVKVNDVNEDGHPDIFPGHSGTSAKMIDGYSGDIIWAEPIADKSWCVDNVKDVSGDGIDDVVVGTLFSNNYCYFLNGVDGSELESIHISSAVDAISAIPDIVGDGSMEVIVGGRDGHVYCYSGGLDAPDIDADFIADVTEGTAPLTVQFTDISESENPITSYEWDFDDDGEIDSEEQDPIWIYDEDGIYTVSLTISDGEFSDTETKEEYITVYLAEAELEIGEIKGRLLRVEAEINNMGDAEVNEVNWSIVLDGNFVILGKESSGTLSSIIANSTEIVTDKPVFGIGQVEITVTANAPGLDQVTKTVDAVIFLFLIIIQG